MKRFFVFLSVLLAIFVVTGCSPLMPDKKITLRMDTTICQNVPVTKPLYSCSTGERRPYDKLIGMNSVPVRISLRKDTVISGNLLPVANRQKSESNSANLGWLWPILAGILGMLILIAALLLAAYLLYRLIRFLFTPRPSGQAPDNHPENAAPNQQRIVVAGGDPNQPTPPQTRGDVYDHQLSMAERLVGVQKIYKVTQKTESGADGSWKSEIEITTKNEEKKG